MSLGKTIKIAAGCMAGVAFVLFVLLTTYKVITEQMELSPANATVQIASVSFKQPMDSLVMIRLKQDIKITKGVKQVFYNPRKRLLIYLFDSTKVSARSIYNVVIKDAGGDMVYFSDNEKPPDSNAINAVGYNFI